jgi:hypothetical protein
MTEFPGWQERVVRSFEEYEGLVRPLALRGPSPYRRTAFRGQANADWHLRSTFARELKAYIDRGLDLPSIPDHFEASLLRLFKSKAHLYAPTESMVRGEPGTPQHTLDWMVFGRHFGLPTRLLDWSYSPYVAAWSAVTEGPKFDAVVWFVSLSHVNSRPSGTREGKALLLGEGEYLSRVVSWVAPEEMPLLFFAPRVHNRRSALQQGLFSIAADIEDHDEHIAAMCSEWKLEDSTHLRIVIPAALKREFVQKLRLMNVTAENLTADLDGFCRELLQVLRDHPAELAAEVAPVLRAMREKRAGAEGMPGSPTTP